MRNLEALASLGLIVLLVGCGEDPKPAASPASAGVSVVTTPPPPVTADAPKDPPKPAMSLAELEHKAGQGIGAGINAHDAKKIASFYTDTAVVKVAGFPDLNGRDAIAADWEMRFGMLSASKSMASRVFVKGDVVITEWAFTATASPEKMGGKGPEKPVGETGVDVMWFTPEGLVKEQHSYSDMGTIASQLGLSKQKSRPVPTLGTDPPTAVQSTGSADEKKNADVVNKMFGAFEKKSEADFLVGMADDVAWDDLTQPETMKGKAAGKKYFSAVTTAFPDAKATLANTWAVGDFVIVEDTLSGTHKAAFFGIQPTKKTINLHSVDIVQFKDGKIVAGRSYGNGMEMMAQLGLLPPPPPAGVPAKK